jgi:hypothetical protein
MQRINCYCLDFLEWQSLKFKKYIKTLLTICKYLNNIKTNDNQHGHSISSRHKT